MLWEAASNGSTEQVARLLEANADATVCDNARNELPLHAACRSDSTGQSCRLLLDAKSDPTQRCIHGGNCLHQAAQFAQYGAVVALLHSLADGAHQASTSLHSAASSINVSQSLPLRMSSVVQSPP